jgi:cytochrome c biogenesis protein CcmG/thiol:disulfide interchange protein DsbE
VLGVTAVISTSIVAALTFSTSTPNIPLLNLPLPQFDVAGLTPGSPAVSSASIRAKGPVVLNFWGSWCPPCTAEMPALQAAHCSLGPQVRFVGIDEQDTRGAALAFLHHVGVTYPSGFDGAGAVASAFRLDGTPTTYFISHGKMLDFHEGRLTEPELLKYVRQIFGIS